MRPARKPLFLAALVLGISAAWAAVAVAAPPRRPAGGTGPGAARRPAVPPSAPAPPGVAAEGPLVLSTRCLSCHNPEKRAGGLDLTTRAAAAAALAGARGGAGGPAAPRLLRPVLAGKMPPTGALPAEETASLAAWLRAGAPYPQPRLSPLPLAERPLWSLRPLRRPQPPSSPYAALALNPVDRFLFQRLAQKGLRPNPPAERAALLRRVTVDLTGLPPTPEELAAFLADRAPGAYERVVDRLLASPAYGERWAQHWLDVVRYGESHGYEQNHLRPTAWPYRDYVIRSLNADKPYDQFVREQLAGDVLGRGDPWVEAATGFLVAGIHDTVGNQAEEGARLQRANDLDDMVATTAEAFLGLTAGCARCHDHKFDPIPQRDYYRLAAVFAGVRHGERVLGQPGDSPEAGARRREEFPPVAARFLRFDILATADGAEPCLDELEAYGPGGSENLALAGAGTRATASSLLPGFPIHQVAHLNDGRLGNEHSWISAEPGRGWAQLEFPRSVTLAAVVWSRDGSPSPRFRDRVPAAYRIQVSVDGQQWRTVVEMSGSPRAGAAQTELPPGSRVYAGQFSPPHAVHYLHRGDVMQRGEEVAPGALSRIPGLSAELGGGVAGPGGPLSDRERRLALARWITDPRNPLTARVIVNRVWQHHFGRGLVGTPSDFGQNGERPSHPELLDWLAADFMAGGWKLKRLHRLLVTSYAYRQSSAVQPRGQAVDAGNQLLWRMPLRRLEAEAVRDAMLAASGKLNRAMGGASFQLYRYRTVNVAIYEPLEEYGPETWRRSIYRQPARAIRDDLLGTFDCPESAQRSPRRESTTTALQALSLLNGPFTVQQAQLMAERVEREAAAGGEGSTKGQVRRAFLLAFGRVPTAEEATVAAELVQAAGLPALCRALFNASEFLYY